MVIDRELSRIERAKAHVPKILGIAATIVALTVLIVAGMSMLRPPVAEGTISTTVVTRMLFVATAVTRAKVVPIRSIALEADVPGRAVEVFVQPGDVVNEGEPLVRLSNPQLELELLAREAEVLQQMTAALSAELGLIQSTADYSDKLIELEHLVNLARARLHRLAELKIANAVSVEELEVAKSEVQTREQKIELLRSVASRNERLRKEQLKKIEERVGHLQERIAAATRESDALLVIAPIDGIVTQLNVKRGEMVGVGANIGIVDDLSAVILEAELDQFYFGRVTTGSTGKVDVGGTLKTVRVTRVAPRVESGVFRVQLEFMEKHDGPIAAGQTYPMELSLGDATETLAIPKGEYLRQSEGQFVYVLDEAASELAKVDIALGKSNGLFVEVIEGLRENDLVVVSSYESFLGRSKVPLESE